jgi:hypothetical protein
VREHERRTLRRSITLAIVNVLPLPVMPEQHLVFRAVVQSAHQGLDRAG